MCTLTGLCVDELRGSVKEVSQLDRRAEDSGHQMETDTDLTIELCASPAECGIASGSPLRQVFDPRYIALSLLVAAAGAFTSLTITVHLRHVRSPCWYVVFVLCAGLALGYSTVWSMHFVGMYALHLVTHDRTFELPITFELFLTVTSAVAAWLISALGLHILASRRVEDRDKMDCTMRLRWLGATALIAAGVCVMHYMGMRSQSGHFTMTYHLPIVGASALVALVAASAGLFILLFFPQSLCIRLLSSVVISLAVNGNASSLAQASWSCRLPLMHLLPGWPQVCITLEWRQRRTGHRQPFTPCCPAHLQPRTCQLC